MAQYVCSGAMMKCTMGMSPSSLVVLPANRVTNNKRPQANIMDHKPMVNIMPFGLCRSLANPVVASATSAAMGTLTPMPCIPNTPSPWMPGKAKMLVANKPALHKPCKLMCAYAGTISLVNPGQVTVKDGAHFSFHSSGKNHSVNAKATAMQAHADAGSYTETKDGLTKNAAYAEAGFTGLEAEGDFTLGGANNPLLSGEGNIKLYNAQTKAKGAAYSRDGIITGAEGEAGASVAVVEGEGSLQYGDANDNVGVAGEFAAASASAGAGGFIGETEDKVGIGGYAGASASVLEGSVEGFRTIPIPFTNWSFQTRAAVSGDVGGVGAGIGGHAYYDKKLERVNLGVAGKLSALLGVGADIEISIGKKYEE